ncbi:hypothetical protein HDU96_005655 [Phlyctochytrium bullatum]|nr:hypothetical protein HDU96_005655 [Phlyctochytrium bullatum]
MHGLLLSLLSLSFFTLVHAHGRLVNPAPLSTGFQILSRGNPCGRANLAAGASTPLRAGQNQMTWFVLNGDGAGPLQVKIDPTGTGRSFTVDARVTKQVPGVRGNVGNTGLRTRANVGFEVAVPNVACQGPRGCLMQVWQAAGPGFGTCAFVTIGGRAGGGAAPAAAFAAKKQPAAKGAAKKAVVVGKRKALRLRA